MDTESGTQNEQMTFVQNEPSVLATVINDANAPDNDSTIGQDELSIGSDQFAKEQDESILSNNNEEVSQGSPLEIVQTRFFSKRIISSRKKILKSFLMTNVLYAIVIYTVIVMFWGAAGYTTKYYHKVKFLAVIQDDIIDSNITPGISTSLSSTLEPMISSSPGKWSIFNSSSFEQRYGVQGTQEINDKVIERIYDEHYWVAINMKPNATAALYQSLISEDSSSIFNSSEFFEIIYETGRDPTNMVGSFLPIVEAIEINFRYAFITQYFPSFIGNISKLNNNSNNNLTVQLNLDNLATNLQMDFNYNDYRAYYRRALISPIQVGLIFAVILSIFHFMLYAPINAEMGKLLKPKHYMFYRIGLTWFTFFFISLFYCSVSAIYKIDFTKAFGRGGFVVYWMTTWMFMLACGGANENVLSLIFLYCPQYLGFWLIFFIIINSSTTFFPFALASVFYRVGYMFPMHNVADIYRVIFFDLTRIKMGRNYGVLIAWIVINTLLAPVVAWHVGTTMKKRAQLQAQKTNQ
ncbi:similar to Saccharomyces cerevisiae YGR197C SNG1 Protein involved in resistance to nitrosoguanidine (MNNG) and 6-azauracil (6-AU) [Maudiozyma saulgeensis]|uniref:Similar to Saccharomyces cerevisiae YGR197C SNG1 Protein involved in resistance to nitrosoguanidine (MNNG) and 6-azauracil (6-AU) n=1 Tax=Maudiozyma saulgeensis TaxID=1789683 RepID=A0A1X7R348_9SACH|nr:similar to Saccharomyces cerevisiae YGR197C SNG1 Protein involved in resistance to nitrosoguanidine (MNNG) and 6-azauracil (6-AU) [Kazachstania saulgeensis]